MPELMQNSVPYLRKQLRAGIEQFFRNVFDIRRGEGKRVGLMWLNIFLIIASLLIIKPVCFSLFLLKFGVTQLPYVFILVAGFAAAVVTYYSRLVKKIDFDMVIARSLQAAVASLLVFRILFSFEIIEAAAFYLFYVWVGVFAVLITSQFWSLANLLFNTREAKRLFGFIGSGAISGGIFGGYLTNFLAPTLGSENLLFISILFLSACLFITRALCNAGGQRLSPRATETEYESSPFKLLSGSRHLLYLAGIVGISVVAAKLVEYQFSAIAAKQIPDSDRLTAFFGFWLSNMGIISLLIQLFLTRRVVGVFGVGTSLFILPAGILVGTAAVLIHPALWSAVLLKMFDGSLKQSINKAGMELMILPIPAEIKNRAKAFIDVFIDGMCTGVGGLLLILVTVMFPFPIRFISVITLALLGLWIYLVLRIREEYVHSFRLKIERSGNGDDAESSLLMDLKNESVLGGVLKIFEQGSQAGIIKTLKMVSHIQNDRLLPGFGRLLKHSSSQVRLEVLRNMYYYRSPGFIEEVRQMVSDPDPEIKVEALRYLFQHSPQTRLELMTGYLQHQEEAVRCAALLCAARESRDNRRLQAVFQIEAAITTSSALPHAALNPTQRVYNRSNCARVIGASGLVHLYPLLVELMKDPEPEVRKAALLGAGESKDLTFMPILIQYLGRRTFRKTALEALKEFGLSGLSTLAGVLDDPYAPMEVRLRIPRVFAGMGFQESVDMLVMRMKFPEPYIRHEIIRALNHLRSDHPFLKFDEHAVGRYVLEEARDFAGILAVFYSYSKNTAQNNLSDKQQEKIHRARRRLIASLEKQLDQNLERIFRLLGLKYPPHDIYNVYLGIQSTESDLRANALEFLDTFLEADLKRLLIPIIEASMMDTLVRRTLKLFDLKPPQEKECLILLLTGSYDRLKIDALLLIARMKDPYYLSFIDVLAMDSHPRVRRAAQLAERALVPASA